MLCFLRRRVVKKSLTVAFVTSSRLLEVPRTTTADSSEEQSSFLYLFSISFSLAGSFSSLILPLPLSSRGSRERRSIINDTRHRGLRNIKYIAAHLRRATSVGRREGERSDCQVLGTLRERRRSSGRERTEEERVRGKTRVFPTSSTNL